MLWPHSHPKQLVGLQFLFQIFQVTLTYLPQNSLNWSCHRLRYDAWHHISGSLWKNSYWLDIQTYSSCSRAFVSLSFLYDQRLFWLSYIQRIHDCPDYSTHILFWSCFFGYVVLPRKVCHFFPCFCYFFQTAHCGWYVHLSSDHSLSTDFCQQIFLNYPLNLWVLIAPIHRLSSLWFHLQVPVCLKVCKHGFDLRLVYPSYSETW